MTLIAELTKASPLPVNIMVSQGANISALAKRGVARVSFGADPYVRTITLFKRCAQSDPQIDDHSVMPRLVFVVDRQMGKKSKSKQKALSKSFVFGSTLELSDLNGGYYLMLYGRTRSVTVRFGT